MPSTDISHISEATRFRSPNYEAESCDIQSLAPLYIIHTCNVYKVCIQVMTLCSIVRPYGHLSKLWCDILANIGSMRQDSNRPID